MCPHARLSPPGIMVTSFFFPSASHVASVWRWSSGWPQASIITFSALWWLLTPGLSWWLLACAGHRPPDKGRRARIHVGSASFSLGTGQDRRGVHTGWLGFFARDERMNSVGKRIFLPLIGLGRARSAHSRAKWTWGTTALISVTTSFDVRRRHAMALLLPMVGVGRFGSDSRLPKCPSV